MLTEKQKREARSLLKRRPPVIPGTRAIITEAKAKVWHELVNEAIKTLGVKPENVWAFCDIAGVAD